MTKKAPSIIKMKKAETVSDINLKPDIGQSTESFDIEDSSDESSSMCSLSDNSSEKEQKKI